MTDAQPEPDMVRTVRRWRRPLTVFLTVVAALSLVLAVTATWVRTTLFDTDEFVSAVAPLPEEEPIRGLLAARIADDVSQLIDFSNVLDNTLGGVGSFLAGPLESATNGFIEDAANSAIASPAFDQLWEATVRVSHDNLVRVLKDDADNVTTVDGQVVLDLVPLINNAIAEASKTSPQLFGGAITIPEMTAAEVADAEQRLADALGIEIPANFGQVPLFSESSLDGVQGVVRLLDTGVIALWVIFGLSVVGALVASTGRRRTIAVLGVTTTVVAGAIWLIREPVEQGILSQVGDAAGKEAAQIFIEAVLWQNLGRLIWVLVIVAGLAAATAFLVGPSSTAVSIRRTVRGLFGGDEGQQTAASRFMRQHVAGFRVAGALVALAGMVSLPQLTWSWFLAITIVLIAYEAAWVFVSPEGGGDHADPTEAEVAVA